MIYEKRQLLLRTTSGKTDQAKYASGLFFLKRRELTIKMFNKVSFLKNYTGKFKMGIPSFWAATVSKVIRVYSYTMFSTMLVLCNLQTVLYLAHLHKFLLSSLTVVLMFFTSCSWVLNVTVLLSNH